LKPLGPIVFQGRGWEENISDGYKVMKMDRKNLFTNSKAFFIRGGKTRENKREKLFFY
jgi:hypothetical protein|tara:strand:- start:313 stop:486 length:174 start_codon:yes stop_codon:yes gene_type:complete